MTDGALQTFRDDIHQLVKDYFGVRYTEAETLIGVFKSCALEAGIPNAILLGGGEALVAGGATFGTTAVPVWIAVAGAAFIGNTATCMMGKGTVIQGVKRILPSENRSEEQFKVEVRRLLAEAVIQ